MSKMLEQAIIDAKALKEAALKNAEAEIVEKYAPEVKKVMESILEAEDDEMDMGIDTVEDPTAMSLPLGAADGETACACPEEKEELDVVLDLPGLATLVADEEPAAGDLENTELAMDNALPTQEDDLPLEEDEIAAVVAELLGEDEETLEENETVEEVKLEGAGGNDEVYEERQSVAESVDLAKIAGKKKELLETIQALQEQNDNFKADNSKMLSGVSEQNEAIQKLTTTLEELSLQNAKLLYTNEVLKADSLNERQKQIAVEALQSVRSVEHAKTVFDTLQSTVVSTKRQGRPESLSEVVSNNTSKKMPRRKQTKTIIPMKTVETVGGD